MDIEIKKIFEELGIASGLGFLSWVFLGADGPTIFVLTLVIRHACKKREKEDNF